LIHGALSTPQMAFPSYVKKGKKRQSRGKTVKRNTVASHQSSCNVHCRKKTLKSQKKGRTVGSKECIYATISKL